jgi:NAD(P)-dependent dehydrogenase (short-subunit alcohol dehydrogenase family)
VQNHKAAAPKKREKRERLNMNFTDNTVIVTGAAGAIGKGIAVAFAQANAKVFITDLTQDSVDASLNEINTGQISCRGLAADVTDTKQVKNVVDAALKAFGEKIDILVNIAGIVGQAKVEDITEADWDKMFRVNCKGTFLFIKNVVPVMKKNKFGRIINFSSKSGKTGSALMSHYSAAKAAIIGLTQALAHELADYGINVNCLCPGITENTGVWDNVSAGYIKNLNLSKEEVIKKFTAKVPLKRLAKIQDIVALTLFLASDGADYMTGQAINITGGREMH